MCDSDYDDCDQDPRASEEKLQNEFVELLQMGNPGDYLMMRNEKAHYLIDITKKWFANNINMPLSYKPIIPKIIHYIFLEDLE